MSACSAHICRSQTVLPTSVSCSLFSRTVPLLQSTYDKTKGNSARATRTHTIPWYIPFYCWHKEEITIVSFSSDFSNRDNKWVCRDNNTDKQLVWKNRSNISAVTLQAARRPCWQNDLKPVNCDRHVYWHGYIAPQEEVNKRRFLLTRQRCSDILHCTNVHTPL